MLGSLHEREEAVAPDAKRFILLSLENLKTVRPSPPIDTPARQRRRAARKLIRASERHTMIFWDFLSENLKGDRDIALAAFVNGHARLEDLPERWNQDRDFFLDAVQKESKCWYELPEDYQTDEDFVQKIQQFESDELVAAIFQKVPTLSHDKRIWDTIISSKKCSVKLVPRLAPISMRTDRELMVKVCSKDPEQALKDLDESLASDKDFLKDVIDMNIEAICLLPHGLQRRFPELLTDNLRRWFTEKGTWSGVLLYWFAHDVRQSPSFVKAWFTSGGLFSKEYLPESMRDSEQIFLWMAEHALPVRSYHSFRDASDRLKGDREFMMKAIEHNPDLFWHASKELKTDDHLLIKALAGSSSFAHEYVKVVRENDWGEDAIQYIRAGLQEQLDVHETFIMTILLGISLPADPSFCPLTVLNQGPETSLIYKKQIAELADVPLGDALWRFRRALQNLRLAAENVDQDDENIEVAIEEVQ